jgi:hypothetical protein
MMYLFAIVSAVIIGAVIFGTACLMQKIEEESK